MARTLIGPVKYFQNIQGPGGLDGLGKYAGSYDKKAFVLIRAGGLRRSGVDSEKNL